MVALILLLSFTSRVLNYTMPRLTISGMLWYSQYFTCPFFSSADSFPWIGCPISGHQYFLTDFSPWSLITWTTLLICLDAFPGFIIKPTSPVSSTQLMALSQISLLWGGIAECTYYFRDISGDIWFLNHQQSLCYFLFYFFYCFQLEENICSRESETWKST